MNTKLKELAVKEKEVYRFGKFTVVKVHQEGGLFGVGISKCSENDSESRLVGEHIAEGRAMKALLLKTKKHTIHHQYMS
jgi:hypothetical protein